MKQQELGLSVDQVRRKMGIAQSRVFSSMKKYSEIEPSELRRLKQLEEENAKLNNLVADILNAEVDGLIERGGPVWLDTNLNS